MASGNHIQYLTRSQIDGGAWDKCIASDADGLIYAKSFYLDALADNWDALVLNDYEAVMPLPWRKKWTIRYVYQVPFLQRLGIFGKKVSGELTDLFYKKALHHFSAIHYKTAQPFYGKGSRIKHCRNFVLPLHPSYDTLYHSLTKECKKNIRKAESRGCQLSKQITGEEVVQLFYETYGGLHAKTGLKDYSRASDLIDLGLEKGFCKLYAVTGKEGERVLSAALLQDDKRVYYWLGAPTERGRQLRATYFFINEMLKQYAGQALYFDFEGSDLPPVASFYKKFSPLEEAYYELKAVRLPFLLNWF